MSPTSAILERAINKAKKSICRYKISALGFNSKGEMIGSIFNTPRFDKYHGGLHAEAALINRYGTALKTIVICRVNKSGGLLPIKPCINCSKLANKYGIKIISISDE